MGGERLAVGQHQDDLGSACVFRTNPAAADGRSSSSIAAVDKGLTDVLRVLLARGADPNARPTRGSSALSRAQDKPEIIQLLINAGAKQ
jgi:hypothetical protein